MLGAGFWEVLAIPALFHHDEWCVTISCHGDDFIAGGESDDLDRLDALMMQSVETKVLPRIGPEEFGGQEADPTYSRQIAGGTWPFGCLQRLGRYLVKYPKEAWHFECQEQPDEAVVLTDADWGACYSERASRCLTTPQGLASISSMLRVQGNPCLHSALERLTFTP